MSSTFASTISKNAVCSFSETGPLLPIPIVLWSIERIGVTSAAVPVKNTSSAMYSLYLEIVSSITS